MTIADASGIGGTRYLDFSVISVDGTVNGAPTQRGEVYRGKTDLSRTPRFDRKFANGDAALPLSAVVGCRFAQLLAVQ